MSPVTPFTWMLAASAVVTNMEHWGDVERAPMVVLGNPQGDLSRCGCEGDGGPGDGQILVTAGDVFYTGDSFPDPDILRRRFSSSVPDEWAAIITIEFARCRPVFAADGRSHPSPARIAEHAERLYDDATAIWTALRCAAASWRQTIGPVIVRGWGPIQRDLGPCSGFSYEIAAKIDPCDNCNT